MNPPDSHIDDAQPGAQLDGPVCGFSVASAGAARQLARQP
jgi:hypothetical protein